MKIIDGKQVSNEIKENIKKEVETLKKKPALAVISVGNDEASKVYVNNKKKACEYVGFNFYHYALEEVTEKEIIDKIIKLNNDDNIDGILVQLPLPSYLNEKNIINSINPLKDVDGITEASVGKQNSKDCLFVPCTAKGIMKLLEYYNIDISSKHVVIVGRSDIVGKPTLCECLKKDATVTMCHSKTKDLSFYTKHADILVAATGKKYLIDKTMIKDDVVIIDVGITRENGKLYGDVNIDVDDICSMKTPVPGGIGPMTVAMLLENTLIAFKNRHK